MASRVNVAPQMLRWARDRARLDVEDLVQKFPNLSRWESGDALPTMKQLEAYARRTYTPIGFFFLQEPPSEVLPVADFRRFRNSQSSRPSPNLLDAIYLCEERQDWYRQYAEEEGMEPLPFIGSLDVQQPIAEAAEALRRLLDLKPGGTRRYNTWADALTTYALAAENAGILVMISGVVASNTHRPLDPEEFQGFSLSDKYAPLVFVNGADTKASQIFTLIHELSHLLLGQSSVSKPDLDLGSLPSGNSSERWCDEVAADFLIPVSSIRKELDKTQKISEELNRLAAFYRVSTMVVLRRVRDIGAISASDFESEYDRELKLIRQLRREKPDESGGNFYTTLPVRASRRFVRAIVADTVLGRTSYGDAFHLLSFRSSSTFQELSRRIGVV